MYGLRIRLEFKDDQDRYYAVNLKQRDYSGQADVRELTGTPAIIEYGDSSADEFPTVLGAMASINFFAEDGDDWGVLYTADRRKFQLEIRKDNAASGELVFIGWLMPQEYSERLTWQPTLSIKALCGLGELKEYDYLDNTGTRYSGRKSYLQILTDLLAKLDLNLAIHAAIDWRDSLMAAGDAFAQSFIDVSIYAGLNCREVLDQILIGCRIMQRSGAWYVESYTALKRATHTRYNYNSTGGVLSAPDTISLKGEINQEEIWTEGTPMLQRWPAYDKLVIKQDYNKQESFFKNHKFADGTTSWINETGFPYLYFAPPGSNETFVKLSGSLTGGIRQSVAINKVEGIFVFRAKASAIGGLMQPPTIAYTPIRTDVYLEVKLVGAVKTWYLNGDTEDTVGVWQEQPCFVRMWRLNSEPYANPVTNTGWTFNWVEVEKRSVVPEAGVLSVFLPVGPSVQYNGAPAYTDLIYTNIVAFQEGEFVTDATITGLNANPYIDVKDDINLLQGTIPQNANAPSIWGAGISYTADKNTQARQWHLDDSTYVYGYAEVISRLLLSLRRRPIAVMQANVVGASIEAVYNELNQPGVDYVFVGGSVDLQTRKIDGNWAELLDYTPDAGVVNSGERVTSGNGDTFRSSGNNETRVFGSGQGTPKRINDLTHAAAVLDGHRFEVDKASGLESEYVEASQLWNYISAKLGVTVEATKTIWDRDFVTNGTIQFFGAGATGGGTGGGASALWELTDVADDMQNSLYGDIPMYNGTHFSRYNISNFATVGHSHAYLSDADARIANWNSAFSWGNHATAGYAPAHTHPYRPDTWTPSWAEVSAKPMWTEKIGWDGTAVTVSTDLHVTGKLVVDGTIQFFGAGAGGGTGGGGSTTLWGLSDVADDVANAVYGDLIMYNGTHFARINQSVLAPAVHYHSISQVTGLQGALDTKMVVHTHPYLSDSDARITNWNTAYTHSQSAHYTGADVGSWAKVATLPTWNQNTTGNALTATTATNWSGSGALANYLPLAGGTLTGALNGTSATLTGTISSTGYAISGTPSKSSGLFAGNGDDGTLSMCTLDIQTWNGLGIIPIAGGAYGNGVRTIAFDARSGSMTLRGSIVASGNATFSGSVTANSDITGGALFQLKPYAGTGAGANGVIYFEGTNQRFVSNNPFYILGGITTTGALNGTAASFSDSVTAGSLITDFIKTNSAISFVNLANSNYAPIYAREGYFSGSVTATGITSTTTIWSPKFIVSGTPGAGSGLVTGNGDAGTLDTCTLDIRTWNGFGIIPIVGGYWGDGVRTIAFDARYGSMALRGSIVAGGNATFSGSVTAGGNITANGTIQFYTASDRRLKKDFEAITNPIEKIRSLTGYFFNYNDEGMRLGGYANRRDIGLIAQEVHTILPEATGKLWGTDYMGYKADKLIPLLVEAIKQQQTEIDQLKRQMAA